MGHVREETPIDSYINTEIKRRNLHFYFMKYLDRQSIDNFLIKLSKKYPIEKDYYKYAHIDIIRTMISKIPLQRTYNDYDRIVEYCLKYSHKNNEWSNEFHEFISSVADISIDEINDLRFINERQKLEIDTLINVIDEKDEQIKKMKLLNLK